MNLEDQEARVRLIHDINSENNKARKQVSFRQFEVQGGRIQQFVKESLKGSLYESSVREMPIVSSINVQKAVVDKKSTIYKKAPSREFTLLNDEQLEVVDLVYKDMKLNMKLNKANKNYVYQDQSIGMIIPKKGKLICRIFNMHQIDAIVDYEDPESAKGFVISAFDRTDYVEIDSDLKTKDTATGFVGRSMRSTANPDLDLEVAEKYQFQKYVEKYIVWSKDYNFMMNGLGEVIDPETGEASNEVDIISPLASMGVMPFFEVYRDKDFEYFVRPSNALTDFTVQFNERLSDLANVQKMNGYAVGILKSPSDVKPNNLVIGASQLIHLPTDDPDKEIDFSFASPSSAISEIADANDKFLNYFVTSEGLGGDVVNSNGETQTATSGIDRFLQAMQKVEAHQDDYEKFRCLEDEIYEIIKAWLTVLNGSDQLDRKYWVSLPQESELNIEFHKPEMMLTETEKLNNIVTAMSEGLMSRKEAIMKLRDITDPELAKEILMEIDEMEISMPSAPMVDLPEPDTDLGADNSNDEDEEDAE